MQDNSYVVPVGVMTHMLKISVLDGIKLQTISIFPHILLRNYPEDYETSSLAGKYLFQRHGC